MHTHVHTQTHMHIYRMEYYSFLKNKGISAFTRYINLEVTMLVEISPTQKDTYAVTYMWNLRRQDSQEQQRQQ